jgi:hypothetical protein
LHRLPINHPSRKDILSKIDNKRAGYNGECQVDHFLKQVNFKKPYAILKEVNLKGENQSFISIDTLIVTREYICVLEIKTIIGIISFQSNPPQLIREIDGIITTYKCPEQQLNRHVKRLRIWMDKQNVLLPNIGCIVLPYSKTRVAKPPEFAKIIIGCDISGFIEDIKEKQEIISREKFDKFISNILEKQTFYIPSPLRNRYKFEYNQIRKELMCGKCFRTITNEKKCSTCKITTKNCKRDAIEDWFYLWKHTISNRECVDFLGLKDEFAASYLLRSLQLIPIGNGRSRKYKWNPKI